MSRGRSLSPGNRDVEMDVDSSSKPLSKPDARVVVVTNLTRNVAEAHLRVVFGFYGEITKIDLPVFGKSGQNRGKAALEFADAPSAHKAASHMDGGQLDGAVLKVELSDLPIRSRSRSPLPPRRGGLRNNNGGGGRGRSYSRSRSRSRSPSRSRSRTRSRSPPPYRRGGPSGYGGRTGGDSYRGRGGYGRRGGGGPAGRDVYRPNANRSRSRSPIRRGGYDRPPIPRRRSPSYTRGGMGRGRRLSRSRTRSRSRSYSVRSSRSRTRSYSRSRSRSRSYSSYSRSRSRSRTRSVSRGRRSSRSRSSSRDDIRDSRSRSPRP